jgi:hypothetical protein
MVGIIKRYKAYLLRLCYFILRKLIFIVMIVDQKENRVQNAKAFFKALTQ